MDKKYQIDPIIFGSQTQNKDSDKQTDDDTHPEIDIESRKRTIVFIRIIVIEEITQWDNIIDLFDGSIDDTYRQKNQKIKPCGHKIFGNFKDITFIAESQSIRCFDQYKEENGSEDHEDIWKSKEHFCIHFSLYDT